MIRIQIFGRAEPRPSQSPRGLQLSSLLPVENFGDGLEQQIAQSIH